MDPDQSAALKIHQKARSKVSVAPLSWDRGLADDAQKYANQLASLDQGMQHSQDLLQQGQGENLASCSGYWSNPCTEASKLWYAEKKHWKGGMIRLQCMKAVGHYTQMVWSSTTHIGMAVAVAPSGTTYVVARYSPAGNRVGQAPYDASKVSDAARPDRGTSQGRSGNNPDPLSSGSKYGGPGHHPGQRPSEPNHQHRRQSVPGSQRQYRHPGHVVPPPALGDHGPGSLWASRGYGRSPFTHQPTLVYPNGPFGLSIQSHCPREETVGPSCCVIL